MKKFVSDIIAPLAVAAITATVIVLWGFNARLASVETKIEMMWATIQKMSDRPLAKTP